MKALLTLIPLLAVQVLLAAIPSQAQARRRNIVLIVADDHGRELGCYGNAVIKTPNLDALAREGTRFQNAFCTTASCSPSRSVILSGLHTHENGMYGLQHATHKQRSHEWVKGLPNLLRDAGYATCLVGKYHVGPDANYLFDATLNDGTLGSRSTVRMAENAERWIRANGEKPFFLYFCPTDPHRAAKGFANDRPYPGVTEVVYDPKDIPVPPFLPDQPEVRKELAEYYQSASRMDQGVGRLMQALRETGRLNDTLVIYVSDNGIPFPGAKTGVYDPGINLPLIVRAPEQTRRGMVSQAMVSWIDLVPTVLAFAGAKGPDYPLRGRSLLPILTEEDPAGWDEIYASHQFHEITMYYPMRAIRTKRYKYILNLAHQLPFPFASDLYGSETWQGVLRRKDRMYGRRTFEAFIHRPRHELYDLQSDRGETRNLADSPQHQAALHELQGKLKTWQEATKDPGMVKYTYE